MYIIRPSLDGGDHTVKYHMVQSEEIMREVLSDLESRFGPMEVDLEDDRRDFNWDPGGMQMLDDRIELDLGNVSIHCLAQHFDVLKAYASSYQPRGTDVQYIKIHSRFACLCISTEQYNKLVSYFDDSELNARAERAFMKAEAALNSLASEGLLIRAVKGSDGKIYNMGMSDEPIDPTDLN